MPGLQGCICRSWLLPVLQDAMDAMAKEKARLRADMEYLQSQLDLVTQQAEAAAAAAAAASKGSSDHTSQVQASHLVAQANRTSGTPEAWTITEGIPTKIGVHSGSRQCTAVFPVAPAPAFCAQHVLYVPTQLASPPVVLRDSKSKRASRSSELIIATKT